ncbi:unnamed protein product [Sphagnum tenellum]
MNEPVLFTKEPGKNRSLERRTRVGFPNATSLPLALGFSPVVLRLRVSNVVKSVHIQGAPELAASTNEPPYGGLLRRPPSAPVHTTDPFVQASSS